MASKKTASKKTASKKTASKKTAARFDQATLAAAIKNAREAVAQCDERIANRNKEIARLHAENETDLAESQPLREQLGIKRGRNKKTGGTVISWIETAAADAIQSAKQPLKVSEILDRMKIPNDKKKVTQNSLRAMLSVTLNNSSKFSRGKDANKFSPWNLT